MEKNVQTDTFLIFPFSARARRARCVEIDMNSIRSTAREYQRFNHRWSGQGLLIGLPSNPVIDFDIPRQRGNTLAQQRRLRGVAHQFSPASQRLGGIPLDGSDTRSSSSPPPVSPFRADVHQRGHIVSIGFCRV